ncbi:MAG: hypothetical protein R2713_20315 [Ilumatobacteraceae bacterium]
MQLVCATANPHKVDEIAAVLGDPRRADRLGPTTSPTWWRTPARWRATQG